MSILRKLGIQLINIHGQHDSASLFDEDNHLAFLDAFAGNEALRSDYGEKYETVAKLRREIDRLTMDEGEKLRRMETLMYQVQDAAEEVRDARDGLSYSADELEQIESRLDVIHKLRRKYGTTCEDILAYLDSARKELDDIEFADDHLERLKGKLQKAEKAAWDAAIALRENR